MEAYYLAGKSLPWYMLSLSNASGMFDISGTMWLVALCVVYGLKSIWIPWLWPVFNQIFLMVYLSTWLRRSNVLTGAEWIETRFGSGPGGELSQFVVIAFAVLSVLGFLAYGFFGIGKFIEIFLPWSIVAPYVPFDVAPDQVANLYGVVFTAIAAIYAILGGMFSIVWTDLLQFTVMAIASVVVAVIAMLNVEPATPRDADTRRLAYAILRLVARSRLERSAPVFQRQDRERRLHALRRLHDDAVVQGRPGQCGRAGPELRHAEDPLDTLAARGCVDERLRLGRPAAGPLPHDRRLRDTGDRPLPGLRDHDRDRG